MPDIRHVAFTVPGEPGSKGRPRFVRATGHTYTPAKTVNYENRVLGAYLQAVGTGGLPHDGPVDLTVSAHFGIPPSWSKRKRDAALDGALPCTHRKDLDNIVKAITDALNTVAYVDDRQIVRTTSRKHYGHVPCVNVDLILIPPWE